ncbi:hypothetical protein TSAR_007788 [Trichomalopsis sarcophagae]|uniref:Uncharacterized protein n=1 Tax=Trichomalopsis sarcophagae TaxID=543379 RepID=A0A232FKF3_9HYME|nr:hypothetical protein TSAR_007788 [Trichomalopsis sarcophagae]
MYCGVLRLELSKGKIVIGFADDIAVVVVAQQKEVKGMRLRRVWNKDKEVWEFLEECDFISLRET